uniref:class I SAM-dependent methyltransferase n=1 Tax=Polaribacter sp. TaxID=1920175 RepID=UPI0040482642
MGSKAPDYFVNRRPEMLKFIPKNASKILEIGCGEGNFIEQLVSETTETWGVEPDISSADIAKTKIFKVLVGTLDQVLDELPENYFDVIVLNDKGLYIVLFAKALWLAGWR